MTSKQSDPPEFFWYECERERDPSSVMRMDRRPILLRFPQPSKSWPRARSLSHTGIFCANKIMRGS
jgi:hypothetical protein